MITQPFNATEILTQLRRRQAVKRKRQFHHSRLMRVRAELVALRQAGGSYRELAHWLCQTHRIRISHTSIMRYLAQLPELSSQPMEPNHAELP
jgi:IS30 family transposase